jgi:hypothetical protein
VIADGAAAASIAVVTERIRHDGDFEAFSDWLRRRRGRQEQLYCSRPRIELVLGYHNEKKSPVVKLFLSRVDELIARVWKGSGELGGVPPAQRGLKGVKVRKRSRTAPQARKPSSKQRGLSTACRLEKGSSDAAALGLAGVVPPAPSIAVVLGLEGAGSRQREIIGLCGTERRQLDPELVEVERRDLFVQVLGQHVDLVLVFPVVGEELDLRQHPIGKGCTYHKARVAGGAPQIDQPPLSQHDQPLTVGIAEGLCARTRAQRL